MNTPIPDVMVKVRLVSAIRGARIAASMRGFRLNGWQRVGIVLSMLWAVAGGMWGDQIAIQKGGAIPIAHYKWCITQPDYDDDECSATFDEEYAVGVRGHWAFAAMTALVPISVAWLLVYIVVWRVRWIRRGLQAST